MRVASGLVNRLTGRGGASIMHLQRQCGVLISVSTPERSPAMEKGDGGSGLVAAAVDEEHDLVLIMGSSSAASAAKREVCAACVWVHSSHPTVRGVNVSLLRTYFISCPLGVWEGGARGMNNCIQLCEAI